MNARSSETVLVTGGAGFIGTWVLRELAACGARPIAFDVASGGARWERILGATSSQVTFVEGNLLDRDQLLATCDRYDVTRLIHLAALLTPACQQDPWTGCQVNVLGSAAVFEAARLRGERIRGLSYASSFAVYGPEAEDAAAGTTAADNRPPTFYGAFKLAVDYLAEQYARHFQIASLGIRPHVVYGPERNQGLTAGPSLATRAAVGGEPFTIGYRGRVGYDYVEDVARAFVRGAFETPRGANVVDLPGELATSEQFADAIMRAVPGSLGQIRVEGPEIPANIPPQPRYISTVFPDWRATTLDEGVRRTVEFYGGARPSPSA